MLTLKKIQSQSESENNVHSKMSRQILIRLLVGPENWVDMMFSHNEHWMYQQKISNNDDHLGLLWFYTY